jgi:archaemetzincin
MNTLMLKRAAKVLTHEIGHMFGMAHCVYFECNMNGSNNLRETDGAPHHLCPVCLRKMHHAIGFDPIRRYGKLRSFYEKAGLADEAAWVGKRIEAIEGVE